MNLGNLVSSQLAALLTWAFGITETHFGMLWVYVLLTNVLLLLPVLCLWMVPDTLGEGKKEKGEEEELV